MFRLIIEAEELYDEKTRTFLPKGNDVVMDLEHSLISLSKWESEYQKPFLLPGNKERDEVFGYLKAMVITPNVDLESLNKCSKRNIQEIQAYIDSPQSATTFGLLPETPGKGETITSELIYYWMIAYQIPWEAQYWHLNRLFSLIRICNIKSNPKQKRMSRRELAERNAKLNAERRAKLGTSG